MKRSVITYLLSTLITIVLLSCDDEAFVNANPLPEANGDAGKLVVVIEKPYWDGPLMKALRDNFEAEMSSLPQPEPFMDIAIVTQKGFSKGPREHHSVLIIEIDDNPSNRPARIDLPAESIWAQGQLIYKLRAANEEQALKLFNANATNLVTIFNDKSRTYIQEQFKEKNSTIINEELEITLNLNADIPNTFTISENFNDLIWMQQYRERYANGQDHEIQMGLLFYTYPYLDTNTFSKEWMIAKRDSTTKKYIAGFIPDSYMKVEQSWDFTTIAEKNINENYVFEIRGVWKMEGALMGGPFMSISMYDEPRNRIITLEGYVYAPQFRKMQYMREIEAILYSFRFTE